MAKTRADLLREASRQYQEVEGYRLQTLTELELSVLESVWIKRYRDEKEKLKANGQADAEPASDERMMPELVAASLVDDDGVKLISMDEIGLIETMQPWLLRTLYYAARELNKLDKRIGATDDSQKKSEGTDG